MLAREEAHSTVRPACVGKGVAGVEVRMPQRPATGGPAMGRSLGTSSSAAEAAALSSSLARYSHKVLLMVGDSSLRNQFMQLARIGLHMEREVPVAYSVVHRRHEGSFVTHRPIESAATPDSSNGFWGGFPWIIASTASNVTLVYAKVWGCSRLGSVLSRVGASVRSHRRRTGMGGWPPDYTTWNFGLHLLHVYPARPVPTASVRCALGYGELVSTSLQELRRLLPGSRFVWRTTNAVCDASFVGAWAAAAMAFHCNSDECATPRTVRLRSLCQRRYNMSHQHCAATFMDALNTRAQNTMAQRVLRPAHPDVRIFDAFRLTAERCDATADGRHYPPLLARLNGEWLATMLDLEHQPKA